MTTKQKIIKSFKLIVPIGISTAGDIIQMRDYQSQVPLPLRELYFENTTKNHLFSYGWLLDNIDIYVVPNE